MDLNSNVLSENARIIELEEEQWRYEHEDDDGELDYIQRCFENQFTANPEEELVKMKNYVIMSIQMNLMMMMSIMIITDIMMIMMVDIIIECGYDQYEYVGVDSNFFRKL